MFRPWKNEWMSFAMAYRHLFKFQMSIEMCLHGSRRVTTDREDKDTTVDTSMLPFDLTTARALLTVYQQQAPCKVIWSGTGILREATCPMVITSRCSNPDSCWTSRITAQQSKVDPRDSEYSIFHVTCLSSVLDKTPLSERRVKNTCF